MKAGDLVELRSKIYHISGVYRSGAVGIIIAIDERVAHERVEVMFGTLKVGCHSRELEVISESR